MSCIMQLGLQKKTARKLPIKNQTIKIIPRLF
nr:MAG TPA: hypothetical protein [Caudoviricetes sp.]